MANRRDTYREALVAEGATPEEIAEVLAEVEVEESGRDPNARARRAGVPELYLGVDWADMDNDGRREAIMAARNWAVAMTTEDEGELKKRQRDPVALQPEMLQRLAKGDFTPPIPRGLYLWSEGDADEDITGFGTGKTRLAAATAQHIVASRKLNVRWVDLVRVMTDLDLSFSNPLYIAAHNRLAAPKPGEMIVLDDIDKVPPTDRNIKPVFALLNDCVNGAVPLLITANRCADDLAEDWGARFGHAAASRIIGHCLDIEVRGRDRRLDQIAS